MSKYFDAVVKATKILDSQPNSIFLGQTVGVSGSIVYKTLEAANVSPEKRIELPVFEDVQMGMSIGLALNGFLPITIFPRFDFLMCAMNQLVNHLEKFPQMSCGRVRPKVIIKTIVGSTKPLYPGPQHCGDYTKGLEYILKDVRVYDILSDDVCWFYQEALQSSHSSLIIEHADLY